LSLSRRLVRSLLPRVLKREYYFRLLNRSPIPTDALSCRQYVKAGDCVLDVGANIGRYTKLFADWVGDGGHIHAFEPIAETFDYLSLNIRKLGLSNVSCHHAAVTSNAGKGKMKVPDGNFYRAELGDTGEEVALVALDDLFPGEVSFIKCDVEGHEVEVIEGAKKIVMRCHPVWLMEVSRAETLKLMQDLEYQAIRLDPGRQDWVFVPNAK
jgi:FkbM family methyltransferase